MRKSKLKGAGIMMAMGVIACGINVFAIKPLPSDSFFKSGIEAKPTPHPDTVRLTELQGEYKLMNDEAWELKTQNTAYSSYIGKISPTREIIDYDKLKAPRYLVELMQRMCYKHGIEPSLIYPIIMYESKFNPIEHNTNGEDSRGLLQVYVNYHRDADPKKLFDPAYNLEYQLDELKKFNDLGIKKGLSGADLSIFISKFGQKPLWQNWIAESIRASYKEYRNAIIKEG